MDQNELSHEDKYPVPPTAKFRGTSAKLRTMLAAGALVTAIAVSAVAYSASAQTSQVSEAQAVTAPAPATDKLSDTPATAGAGTPEAAVAAVPEPAPQPPAPAAEPPAPAEAAPAPAPVPAPEASNAYTVVAGDTVGAIAARFGVDMNAMLAANGLGAYSTIVAGQVLKLTGPAVAAPAAPAAAPAPAPAAEPAPAPAPAPAVRTIYVAGSGGQSMVDACIGPIHFTPNDGYSLFITEHDFCGGWARFSGIGVGETVTIAGYGTYTVTGRGQVPNPGTTNDVIAVFGGFPRAILQTCIPGTSQMLVIGLN
jgi:LysM repeat protein